MRGIKINRDSNAMKKAVSKNMKVTGLLVAFIIGAIIANTVGSLGYLTSYDIVTLKSDVPQEGRIMKSNLETTKMTRAEFNSRGTYKSASGQVKSAVVLASDMDTIADKAYASYFLRHGTPIYWDSLSKETPKKYSYLYKMDGELLYVDIDAGEFGRMLVPGDHINVRISYEEELYKLNTVEEYTAMKESGVSPQTTANVQSKLFNDVSVMDILNKDGESIFDLYYELLALPKAQQQKMIDSEDFLKRVEPVKILLQVTPEEADFYMSVQDKNPKYLLTLLPRTSSNLISEALNDLETGFARKSSK